MRHKISLSSRTWSAKVVSPTDWQADVDLIFGPFTEFLRTQGYADDTIHFYQRFTVRAARHLASQGQRITGLSHCGLPALLRDILGNHVSNPHRNCCRAALRRWLKFNGTFHVKPQAGWIEWVDAFDHFALAHRGLAVSTRSLCRYFLCDFLHWLFERRAADWSSVRPQDIWAYVSERSRRVKISTVSRGCSVLRAFFRFLHLRGDCSQQLIAAVPTIANRGPDYNPGVLSEAQCKCLLAASRRHSRRDGSPNGAGNPCRSHIICSGSPPTSDIAISPPPGGMSARKRLHSKSRRDASRNTGTDVPTMKNDPFASLIKRFFADFLPIQRNLSAHIISSYRDTFRLLLQFLAKHHRTTIDALGLEHFSPETTLAFLDHLERSRGNTVSTRNNRLAALRSFARFALAESAPDFIRLGLIPRSLLRLEGE